MEKYEGVSKNLKHIAANNFVGGIAWALGATVGIAIIILLLTFVSSKIHLVPLIGGFVAEITKFVLATLEKSPK